MASFGENLARVTCDTVVEGKNEGRNSTMTKQARNMIKWNRSGETRNMIKWSMDTGSRHPF